MKRAVILFSVLLAAAILLSVCSAALAQMPGAIWTTDTAGTVNRNIYYAKCDVYLNGGPAHRNSPGLPDGAYYYQVTDPSGADLLSTGAIGSRTLTVAGGWVVGLIQLCPYLDTSNPGGEYKVWITAQSDFIAETGPTIRSTPPRPGASNRISARRTTSR